MTWEYVMFFLIIAWIISRVCNTIYCMYEIKQKSIIADTIAKQFLEEVKKDNNGKKVKAEVK